MFSTIVGNPAYGQPNNESFCNLMERVQYNAALAIADGVKGIQTPKYLYELLPTESHTYNKMSKPNTEKLIYLNTLSFHMVIV